jgi:hypothetical protein
MLIVSRCTTPAIFGLNVIGILVSALAFIHADRVPAWAPHPQFNPGLDLQGGSCLLLEVDTNAVVKERLDAARAQALPALGLAGVRQKGPYRPRPLPVDPASERIERGCRTGGTALRLRQFGPVRSEFNSPGGTVPCRAEQPNPS